MYRLSIHVHIHIHIHLHIHIHIHIHIHRNIFIYVTYICSDTFIFTFIWPSRDFARQRLRFASHPSPIGFASKLLGRLLRRSAAPAHQTGLAYGDHLASEVGVLSCQPSGVELENPWKSPISMVFEWEKKHIYKLHRIVKPCWDHLHGIWQFPPMNIKSGLVNPKRLFN